jgi:hypothetical protein
MTFRFIHPSDLHLGKRFGQFSGYLSAKFREARHATIGTLGDSGTDAEPNVRFEFLRIYKPIVNNYNFPQTIHPDGF